MDSDEMPTKKLRLGPIPPPLLRVRGQVDAMLQGRHAITPYENLIMGVTVAMISEIDADVKDSFAVLKSLYIKYHRILKDREKLGGDVSAHLWGVSSAAEKELLNAKRI